MDFDYTTETITPDTTNVLTIGGTGGLELSVGTTAQRPVSPINGTFRYNTDLTSFEGYANNSWTAVGTGGSVTSVSATQPAAGITITGSPITTSGTFVFALANDLLAVEGLATTGIATRTASNTWTTRTITGTASRITLTNGDGVASNPTVDISSTYVGQTSITTLGTVGTGTWQGTAVGATFGGTGQTSYAVGDILYANTTTTLGRLADIALGNALISGGVGVAPSYGKIGLTTHVSGILPIANGGTALSTVPTNGQLLIGNGTGYTVASLTAGTGISITPGAGSISIAAIGGGTGTVTSVAATQPAAGITITGSPITTSGTLTFALSNDLLAIENLATTGIATRTAADTWTTRTITGTTNTITVSNGNGVAGNPTITIADNAVLPGTAGYVIPTGTTAQRPVSPTNGTIRYNTTLGFPEVYYDGTWYRFGTSAAIPGSTGILAIYTGAVPAGSGTSAIPYDNTVPTSTEGTQIFSTVITPIKTTSEIRILIPYTVDCGSSNRVVITTVFRGTLNIGTSLWFATGGGRPNTGILSVSDSPGTTAATTYSMRAGIGAGSATWYINSTSSGNDMGGSLISTYQITEIG
jgi:hypothetical protein